jgi:carboxymethylenebutenolidase
MSAGPDLGAVFDEHVASEFETKDIDATMRTMVDEPYVWHVPALTGASGGEAVRRFYTSQFIGTRRRTRSCARSLGPSRQIAS